MDSAILSQFRRELEECRQLYTAAGRICAEEHPHLVDGSPQEFVAKMDDLHRGLLVKVFVCICEADRRWSSNERRLASILFEHVWNRRLEGSSLQQALAQVAERSAKLHWYALVRPFDQIGPLREHIAELETIVVRVANMIAKADPHPAASAGARVRHIQQELATHLRPIPLETHGTHETMRTQGGQAMRSLPTDAQATRKSFDLEESTPVEPEKTPAECLKEALTELHNLIGLDDVKHEVETLSNFLKVQKARVEAGLPQTQLSLHMVFTGNPGTGKTSVARIVAKVFGALGVLEQGHTVETDRSGLVAEYAGQTGPKTNQKIDEALGGVLFIDEAYSLIAEEGDDPFGAEAVQTLLKRMEDDRDRLVVILAGYPDEMASLLASNPGLSSRFSRQIQFSDYAPLELAQIFWRLCQTNHYELSPAVRVKLLMGLDWLYEHRDRHFGNGRLVRNLFEQAVRRLANRIADIPDLTRDHLVRFEPADVDFASLKTRKIEPVPEALFKDIEDGTRRLRIACPGCSIETTMRQHLLLRRVQCKQCDEKFTAAWGMPKKQPKE